MRCQRSAVAAFRNSELKRGINMSKMRVTCPTGMGSLFDSKQLVCVSSKYLQ